MLLTDDNAREDATGHWSRERIEAAIGEPLMVPDPLLTAAQAATLLDVSMVQLNHLVAACQLRLDGVQARRRRYRLSDVEQAAAISTMLPPARPLQGPRRAMLGRPRDGADPISLREAARIADVHEWTLRRYYFGTPDLPRLEGAHRVIDRHDAVRLGERLAKRVTIRDAATLLGYTQTGVRQLLRDRILDRAPDTRRPVRVDQVERLLASGWRPPQDRAHAGRIDTAAAARLLGSSWSEVTQRARDERLPAVRDARGRWWFDPDQLAMVVRARRSEELGVLAQA
jgi:hypothetical protein